MFAEFNRLSSCRVSQPLPGENVYIPLLQPVKAIYCIKCYNYYCRFAISTTCHLSRNSFSFRFDSFKILLIYIAVFDWVAAVSSSRILVTDTFLIWWIKLMSCNMAGVLEEVLKMDRPKTFENGNETINWSWYLVGHLRSK